MNVVQNKLYLINKCCNYDIYSYAKINIQSKCGNIKHNQCADSQVSWPVANTKVVQKSISFSK